MEDQGRLGTSQELEVEVIDWEKGFVGTVTNLGLVALIFEVGGKNHAYLLNLATASMLVTALTDNIEKLERTGKAKKETSLFH